MNKKALIVIDVQKYFLNEETRPIVKRIAEFLKDNSEKYSAVYFTIFKNDENSSLWRISDWKDCATFPDTNICDELKEFAKEENLFYKNTLSAYKVPEIKQRLKEQNIVVVDLCGFDTDCCVLATAYDLFDSGIKPIILEKLTGSTSKEKLHQPAIQMVLRNIGFVE